jgi:hypothetical protein
MSTFRGFLHGLVHSTRTILFDEILFNDPRKSRDPLSLPWEKFRENPMDNSAFFNFLSNSPTISDEITPQNWLINRIGKSNDLLRRFEIPGVNFIWNQKTLETYFDSITVFLEKLLLLLHISGGQPARAPEILSLQYINSLKTGLRNIFLENGLICFVTYYHKGYSVSDSTKIIHRYLPREIGELLVYYLWLIVPFVSRIYQSQPKSRHFSEYLFQKISLDKHKARIITSDDFRRIFRRETEIGLGLLINPSQYRHIAIGISRKFLKKEIRFDDDEFDDDDDHDLVDDVIDLQAGHSTRVGGLTYARGISERSGEISSLKNKFRETSLVSTNFISRFLRFIPTFIFIKITLILIKSKFKINFDFL